MKYLFVSWLLVTVCKLKNTCAICWDTSCQLNGWPVRGCQLYGLIETGQKSCPGGIIFSCCQVNQTSTKRISQKCLDTSSNRFRCASGNCIDQKFVCNGIRNCDDGTDETKTNCENNECSGNQFRCGYGACIDSKLKCDGFMQCLDGSDELSELCKDQPFTPPPKPIPTSVIESSAPGSCTLPADSPDKKFIVQCPNNRNCSHQPRKEVPWNTEMNFTCNPGYQSDDKKPFVSRCFSGVWSPPIKNCKKICKSLKPKNVDLVCYNKGAVVDCQGTLVTETIVRPRCKPQYHEEYPIHHHNITCQADGEWTHPLFSCAPDCGKPNANLTKLIANGKREEYGDSPWHVAIYDIWKKDKPLICGGTIISPQLVLSAAHCFFEESNETAQATDRFEIVVSKFSRNYTTKDNGFTKYYKIREIYFSPHGFTGKSTNYASDIVIIWLAERISLNQNVLPACIHWTDNDSNDMLENLEGKLVGWGLNKNENSSEILLSANLSHISHAECIKLTHDDFKASLTLDKFCAGSNKGAPAGARQGNSGGGLMFRDPNTNLYYLQGILSVTDQRQPAAAFTKVAQFINWINDIKKQVEKEVLI